MTFVIGNIRKTIERTPNDHAYAPKIEPSWEVPRPRRNAYIPVSAISSFETPANSGPENVENGRPSSVNG